MPLLSASHGPFFVYSSSKAQEIVSQVGLKHFGQGTEPCSCTVLQRHWLSSGIPFCWSSSSSVRKLVFQLCPSEPCEDLMRARIRFRFFLIFPPFRTAHAYSKASTFSSTDILAQRILPIKTAESKTDEELWNKPGIRVSHRETTTP